MIVIWAKRILYKNTTTDYFALLGHCCYANKFTLRPAGSNHITPLQSMRKVMFLRAMLSVITKVSLERRWSIHTFRYGCLVTTSSLSSIPPSNAGALFGCYRLSWRDGRWVQDPRTYSTRRGWYAFTSDSSFMRSSCRPQSELRKVLGICSVLPLGVPLCFPL